MVFYSIKTTKQSLRCVLALSATSSRSFSLWLSPCKVSMFYNFCWVCFSFLSFFFFQKGPQLTGIRAIITGVILFLWTALTKRRHESWQAAKVIISEQSVWFAAPVVHARFWSKFVNFAKDTSSVRKPKFKTKETFYPPHMDKKASWHMHCSKGAKWIGQKKGKRDAINFLCAMHHK